MTITTRWHGALELQNNKDQQKPASEVQGNALEEESKTLLHYDMGFLYSNMDLGYK